jgi:hypothetical protein
MMEILAAISEGEEELSVSSGSYFDDRVVEFKFHNLD